MHGEIHKIVRQLGLPEVPVWHSNPSTALSHLRLYGGKDEGGVTEGLVERVRVNQAKGMSDDDAQMDVSAIHGTSQPGTDRYRPSFGFKVDCWSIHPFHRCMIVSDQLLNITYTALIYTVEYGMFNRPATTGLLTHLGPQIGARKFKGLGKIFEIMCDSARKADGWVMGSIPELEQPAMSMLEKAMGMPLFGVGSVSSNTHCDRCRTNA